jgi:hypothetical protein
MRIRRRLPIILAVLLVAAAVALAVVLRKHAPPEAARLLPAADGFVYINLGWMRRANLTGELPVVPHDPEYEQFIQATGFQFERDLDEAALAIHYPAMSAQTKPDSAQPPRFSEVFVGKFDGERLRSYLRQISSSVDNYQTRDIYNIPLEGRTVRVAILGVDTVAASNLDDPLAIRGIIDRSRKLASPFGGPACCASVTSTFHSPVSAGRCSRFHLQETSPLPARLGGHSYFQSRRRSWPRCATSERSISGLKHLLQVTKRPASSPGASRPTSISFAPPKTPLPHPAPILT